MKSPSGAAFGSVLGLMAFFYFFARLTLFCAAWIATAEYKDDPRMPGKHSLKTGRVQFKTPYPAYEFIRPSSP